MYFDSYITGKRIQQLRKTKGLTQEQFAIKLNISDRYLDKKLNHKEVQETADRVAKQFTELITAVVRAV